MTTIQFVTHDGQVHSIDAEDGVSIEQAAIDNSVPGIEGSCGGNCACGTCQVYVDFAWIEKLPEKSELEEKTLAFAVNIQSNSRLSCRLIVAPELDGLILNVPVSQF